jgi:hypothetical protein
VGVDVGVGVGTGVRVGTRVGVGVGTGAGWIWAIVTVKLATALMSPTVTHTGRAPKSSCGTKMAVVKPPVPSVAGSGAGRTSISPIISSLTRVKRGKLVPTTFTLLPGRPLAGSILMEGGPVGRLGPGSPIVTVKVVTALTFPTVTCNVWDPSGSSGTKIVSVKPPVWSVAGTGDGRTSIAPIFNTSTVEKEGKLVLLTVTRVPRGPVVGLRVTDAPGTWWAVVVATLITVPGMVNSASTLLVEGMAASWGTVKAPLMLPAASGVRVATIRSSPATKYFIETARVGAAPSLILSAGNPVPVTLTAVPLRLTGGSNFRLRGSIIS